MTRIHPMFTGRNTKITDAAAPSLHFVDQRGVSDLASCSTTPSDALPLVLPSVRPTNRGPLRLPPYGRDVIELIAGGTAPNVYVFAGESAWVNASERIRTHGPGSALVLPPDDNVELYRWPAVPNGVLLDARLLNYQSALRIASCIVSFGSTMVLVLGPYSAFQVCTASWSNGFTRATTT